MGHKSKNRMSNTQIETQNLRSLSNDENDNIIRIEATKQDKLSPPTTQIDDSSRRQSRLSNLEQSSKIRSGKDMFKREPRKSMHSETKPASFIEFDWN